MALRTAAGSGPCQAGSVGRSSCFRVMSPSPQGGTQAGVRRREGKAGKGVLLTRKWPLQLGAHMRFSRGSRMKKREKVHTGNVDS